MKKQDLLAILWVSTLFLSLVVCTYGDDGVTAESAGEELVTNEDMPQLQGDQENEDDSNWGNNEEIAAEGVLSTNVHDLFLPRSSMQREERLIGCNCSSQQQCCYSDDKPFCCPKAKKCCGNTCCASYGICCRSKTTAGIASCCAQGTVCSSSGECSNFLSGKSWYHVPFILGVLLFCLLTCSISCVCYSRMQQRRRQILAAQLALRLATMNPHQFEDNVPTGVPRRVVDNLPTQLFKKGCMPAENALCSICLNDYEEEDELRTLPCTHLFHSKCIDRWLANHTTCPLCIQPVVESAAASVSAASASAS